MRNGILKGLSKDGKLSLPYTTKLSRALFEKLKAVSHPFYDKDG
jgi:hypothetical protein